MAKAEKLLNKFRELTDVRKQQVIDFVELLRSRQEKESYNSSNDFDCKYTFDSIVVGCHNHMAYQVANDFAMKEDHSARLLYFYGEVGLGKTHLVQAIGHYLSENKPYLKVEYVVLNDFTDTLIHAISNGSCMNFRKDFLTYDVIIFDELECLINKEHTQEEFRYVLSLLLKDSKQVIIACTKSPQEMMLNKVRMSGLFEFDAVCEILKPDFNTKVAIIKQKADLEKVKLSNAAITTIAQREYTVRELINDTNEMISNIKLYWAKLGKLTLENPDMPIEFIRDMLIAKNMNEHEPFGFEKR